MAEKITKAMNDGAARANAVEKLGLGELAQVSNTEYAVVVKDAEGNDKVAVIKVTIPKAQIGIEAMVEAYEVEKAEKEEKAKLREAERAVKKAQKASKEKSKEEVEEVEF